MPIKTEILRNQFFIPFGRFRIFRKRSGEASGVLIGRESQRAFLVDALSGIGNHGAFLVTGRRGVGKSTFVDKCLEEYQQNAFRRFLGSGAGRSIFDILLLLLFTAAVLIIGLAASELLELLVVATQINGLFYIPIVICVTITLVPFYLAACTLKSLFKSIFQRYWLLYTFLSLISLTLSIYTLPLFGAPAQSLTFFLLVLAIIVVTSNSFYFFKRPMMAGKLGRRAAQFYHFFRNVLLPVGVCGTLVYTLMLALDPSCATFEYKPLEWWNEWACENQIFAGDNGARDAIYLLSAISVALLCSPYLANFLILRRFLTIKKVNIGGIQLDSVPKRNLNFGIIAFLTFHSLPFLGSYFSLNFFVSSLAILLVTSTLLATVRIYLFADLSNDKKRIDVGLEGRETSEPDQKPMYYFAPPVEALLLLKAAVLICVSLHLLYPVYGLSKKNENHIEAARSIVDQAPDDEALVECGVPERVLRWNDSMNMPHFERPVLVTSTFDHALEPDCPYVVYPPHFSLFGIDSDEGSAWLIILFVLLSAIFLIEYDWINRPFEKQRQSRALDHGPRNPFQLHHHMDPMWYESWMAYKGLNVEDPDDKMKPSRFDRRGFLQRTAIRRFRELEATTFANVLIRLWMPVIIVKVNLGFDSLEHRGVTHAMLYGLRENYKRTFVARRSPYSILSTLAFTLLLLVSLVWVCRAIVDFPGGDTVDDFTVPVPQNLCHWLDTAGWPDEGDTANSAFVPKSACFVLGDKFGDRFIRTIFQEIVSFPITPALAPVRTADYKLEEWENPNLMVFTFVHYNYGTPFYYQSEEGLKFGQIGSITVRFYHLITGAIIASILRGVFRATPILPYRRNLRHIDRLIESLTRSSRETVSRANRFGLNLPNLGGVTRDQDENHETFRDPMDPRSVELALLSLLDDIRQNSPSGYLNSFGRLTIPRPELHFIFDELDKIGGIVGSEFSSFGVGNEEKAVVDAERRRAFQIHSLLSDMKRLIASAPARFIFVGGRMLHDEWIRDQNRIGSRQPLLTSIFEHEIYLPSLLLDFPRSKFENSIEDFREPDKVDDSHRLIKSLDYRVRELLIRYYLSSKDLDEEFRGSEFTPLFSLPDLSSDPLRFEDSEVRKHDPLNDLEIIDGRVAHHFIVRRRRLEQSKNPDDAAALEVMKQKINQLERVWKAEFFENFAGFLSYRSAGSPKKLHEILASMVRPSGAYAQPALSLDHMLLKHRDILVVDSKDLYRIQFINTIFRHVEKSFGTDLLQRDDKIMINTFLILDFLMKLHNRAFSWSSIERLDELAHIHRAPDLRRLFDAVLSNSAERFFHRVLNGLYAFRFRSEIAIEIRYLSRISQHEMAALNFTLDESQELKTTFSSMLSSSGDANPDLYIALGELYEYDQAYDMARGYYEKALSLLDAEFVSIAGATLEPEPPAASSLVVQKGGTHVLNPTLEKDLIPFMRAILTGEPSGKVALQILLPWAIRRLRIMMQIGLTFEQPGDEERAQAQYHSAHIFARALLDAALASYMDAKSNGQNSSPMLQQVLKHLSIIFQPVFASAWIAEKMESGVDTSLSIVIRELNYLRVNLPFVSNLYATANEDLPNFLSDKIKERDGGSNHALIMAELNNKAGDLHFFKGRAAYAVGTGQQLAQAIEAERVRSLFGTNNRPMQSGYDGYLMRSHYHYAIALHEVRRYVTYRNNMSHARLNVVPSMSPQDRKARWNTLDNRNLPTFVLQTSYSSLVDLAGVTLARSSLMVAWKEMATPGYEPFASMTGLPYTTPDFSRLSQDENDTTGEGSGGYAENSYKRFRTVLDDWFFKSENELSNSPSRDPALRRMERAFNEFLGSWKAEEEPRDTLLGFTTYSTNSERIIFGLLAAFGGARFCNRANYPDTASFEHQILSEHVLRYLKNARTMLIPESETCRRAGLDFSIKVTHVRFLTVLIEFACMAVNRQLRLHEYAYPPEAKADSDTSFSRGDAADLRAGSEAAGKRLGTSINLATICELELVVKGLKEAILLSKGSEFCVIDLASWDDALCFLDASTTRLLGKELADCVDVYLLNFEERSDCKIRRRAHAKLTFLVTHYKYPVLGNLQALKAVTDDILIEDGPKSRTEQNSEIRTRLENRCNQALTWIEEIVATEKVLEAPMHFTPSNMAETLSLATILLPNRARHFEKLARKYRWKAEQSYTMGRQYYQNLSRLHYLFDEFNDRRRHANHASQMGMADILAYFRQCMDKR